MHIVDQISTLVDHYSSGLDLDEYNGQHEELLRGLITRMKSEQPGLFAAVKCYGLLCRPEPLAYPLRYAAGYARGEKGYAPAATADQMAERQRDQASALRAIQKFVPGYLG